MLWWFVQNTVFVGIAVLILALICKAQRFSPAVRHALWLVVLIKMLTPPLVVWPWGIPFSAGRVFEGFAPQTLVSEAQRVPQRVEYVDSFVDLTQAAPHSRTTRSDIPHWNQAPRDYGSFQSPRGVHSTWIGNADRWIFWGAVVWVIGGLFTLVLNAVRTLRLLCWMRRADEGPAWLKNEVVRLARTVHVVPPRVVLSGKVATPVVWGIARPTMIWPAHLSVPPASSLWEGIIIHELAHLKRGDHWVGVLEITAAAIWWWNPLLWYVRHQLRENAELACDAWVVAALPEGRRAYAEAILEICQSVTRTAATAPACGVGRGPRRSLERRLAMILRERVRFRIPRVGLLAIALLALVALPSWSQTQDSPPIPQLPQLDPFSAEEPELSSPPALAQDGAPPSSFDPQLQGPGVAPDFLNAATSAAAPQSSSELQNLEQQLVQLLEQVRSLQAAGQPQSASGMIGAGAMTGMPGAVGGMSGGGAMMMPGMSSMGGMGMMGAAGPLPPSQGIEVVESIEVRVYRTTYRLPEDKAQAMQLFVQQYFISDVETRVDGNMLVVQTHSAADNETMRRFIYLMVGAPFPQTSADATSAPPDSSIPAASLNPYAPGSADLELTAPASASPRDTLDIPTNIPR